MSDRGPPTVVVDACAMMPPEPMERTLEGLDQLGPGDTLLLIIPRQPAPLFDVLLNNGYSYSVATRDDGIHEITIWQDSSA